MAVIGTFGSFTAARLGIYASQSALNVTGNNIANINTEGYTRQRLDLVSLYSNGNIRYANSYNLNIGYGVLTEGVSQLRDPFLDIRYRNENANVGSANAKLDCLQQLAHILDEVGKGTNEFGIVEAQFNDLLTQLETFNGKVGSVEYDTAVRGSAQTLVRLLNDYAKAMNTLGDNKLNELKKDVGTVNSLLTQIRDLSVEIRDAGIYGDKALELRDARNLCIDKLSAYMKIDVSYDMEKIDEFNSVERINISIADSGTPPIKLIQGIYGAQISMPDIAAERNPNYKPDLPTSNRYISQDSTAGNIKYTNIAREALRDKDGNIITNEVASNTALKETLGITTAGDIITTANAYDINAKDADGNNTSGPYIIRDDDGEIIGYTEDASAANQVENAVEGSDSNRLWMTVEPLVDAKGQYMRDQYHKEIKESVDLTDNQLHGSLQAMREFLTERGEFCSDDDLKFDPNAAQKRGLWYYKDSLDALARKFAGVMNEANRLNFDQVSEAYKWDEVDDPKNPGTDIKAFYDKDHKAIMGVNDAGQEVALTKDYFDELAKDLADIDTLKAEYEATAKDTTLSAAAKQKKLKEIQGKIDAIETKGVGIEARKETAYKNMETLREQGQLTDVWAFYNGGVLFSNNGDTNDFTNITAENITISKDWSTGDVRILNTKKPDDLNPDDPDNPITHSTRDDNLYHIIGLMSYDFTYYPNEIVDDANAGGTKKYFTGSFQERLADMNNIRGVEEQTTGLLYNNYAVEALSLENSRQSVCGVDLNDEATSMMMFQKSYAASCQLMTTLDSMLDKLINDTVR
ncbi:FlgK family flagellar hook-associated protein [Lawsonibacter sp. JLR.KK007]|uniref:FlgK family flagellar hook-associated protein n=1 Tax=Lawsonibacter sp. JLR.KK007 TaxID=3114293 RepID=UPI002FF27202